MLLLFLTTGAWSAGPPPNVVLITIDTLRADHLGCYGYKAIRTPNIDALAKEGVRFERAFTPVPITLPAHSALLTGTYPTTNGMHDFSGNKLSAQQPTLAKVLRQAGYRTGAVVGSAVLDSRFGLDQGFDLYYDHFDFNRLLETNIDEMERPGNEVVDKALAWLDKNGAQRFLLWVHIYDPHYPYRPPSPFREQYKSNPYDGEIAFADAQVGRLVSALKRKDLYQRTMIVLLGDHGEGLGEHDEKTHGFFIYNSTLHVPLIFKLPAKLPAGASPGKARVVADDVSLVDVLPTILNVAAVDVPSGVQGRSLLPLLRGTKPERESVLYSETLLPRLHFDWSELRGLQAGGYHFIAAPKPEVYDLANDPHELHNLFAEKKAVAEEMQGRLQSTIRQYLPDRELAEKTGLDPALMERLKSLGYAGFSGGKSQAAPSDKLPDPKDRIRVYERISEAIEDSQHGRYAASVEKLRSTLDTEKDSVPVHYLLGIDYFRLNDFPSAVQEFQRVLQLSPDYALATFYLGLAYANAGDVENAITMLQRTLELDATNFAAAYNLGAAYLHKQMVPEAMAAFRKSVTINPEYAPA
ncbi:MAG: sulfatase-like hydrolase/transferase, partial [Acidobacteriota bacterium]|nr:sulfatase-like hydrolase/transferase [Acidobacteriota bacterium]